MARAAIFDLFSLSGLSAETKLVLLGAPDTRGEVWTRARSLHIEHVSPAQVSREISRPSTPRGGPADEAATLPLMRRWFFARKPDAGFVLADFPATLLQALVLDEWLEARDEAIDAVLAGPGASAPVVAHYRDLGLLAEPPSAAEASEGRP